MVFVACIIAFLIGFGNSLASEFGPIMMLSLVPIYTILWSLPYLVDRLVSPKLKGLKSTLVFPLAAATIEIVNNLTNPVGSWGSMGFSQYGNLALMQLASVTGMIGITFLMGWFASVANWSWENKDRGGIVLKGVTVFGIVAAMVFAFGYLRLNLSPLSDNVETVRVAGITTESMTSLYERAEGITDVKILQQLSDSRWIAFFEETVREAQAGANVVIWPEGAGVTSSLDEPSYIARAQDVARQNGIYLAIGFLTYHIDGPIENKFLIFDPNGTTVIEHIKYGGNMFEGSVHGNGKLQSVSTPFGVISGVVCWDADFPTIIQQSGKLGIGLMLVPANDWIEIDPLHSQMAVFRAIENGMSLVRQVDESVSIAVDPYGRILAQTDFYGSTDRTLIAQVPVRHVTTIYTLFGRWLEWLAPVGLLYFVIRTMIARRQEG